MAKSYFLHQTEAKSNTFKLVVAYTFGLLVVPLLINIVLYFFDDSQTEFSWRDHFYIYGITVGVCAIPVIIGSLFFYFKYSGPGYKVAEALGASPIDEVG